MKIIENKKEMANTDRNPDPGLGQAQNCDRVKPLFVFWGSGSLILFFI
jgi:hypothetical protein